MTIKRHLLLILLISFQSDPLCWSQNAGSTETPATEEAREPESDETLTLEDVVDLLELGSKPEEILSELEMRGYSDSADAPTLLKLKKLGASKALLAAVKWASDEAAKAREAAAEAMPKPSQDLPWGTAILGRPGFVNSPFAAKHQLVDVTGLIVGMEVKCPYTGKLFRVPSPQ